MSAKESVQLTERLVEGACQWYGEVLRRARRLADFPDLGPADPVVRVLVWATHVRGMLRAIQAVSQQPQDLPHMGSLIRVLMATVDHGSTGKDGGG